VGDLPLVGLVFRKQGKLMQKTETIIFLTIHTNAVQMARRRTKIEDFMKRVLNFFIGLIAVTFICGCHPMTPPSTKYSRNSVARYLQ